MPVDLDSTLAWTQASGDTLAMLETLQANIVKSHSRAHMAVLALRFDLKDPARACLAELADPKQPVIKPALAHRDELEKARAATPYVGIGLSHAGYQALEVPDGAIPSDVAFRNGMRRRRARLGDPPLTQWKPPFDEPVHGLILIGAPSSGEVTAIRSQVEALLDNRITVIHRQDAELQRNSDGEVVEHFGFRDGISTPRFLEEERRGGPRAGRDWQPVLKLQHVLVPDPGAGSAVHHGSYLVYRKLQQHVQAFRDACEALAKSLGPQLIESVEPEDRETAVESWFIGRTRSGKPLAPGAPAADLNDFTYADDASGVHCPFPAHIRKVNPRGSSSETDGEHLMARRGITYADPDGGVGLLFMALNSDLRQQFEFVQHAWANDFRSPQSYGRDSGGIDQIIGPAHARTPITLFPGRADRLGQPVAPLPPTVTMRGGEYFFLPSLATLRRLPSLP